MRLTNYQRDAFISAIMNDVPKIDYQTQAEAIAKEDAYNQMPVKVKEAFNDKTLLPYFHKQYFYFRGMNFCSVTIYAPEGFDVGADAKTKLHELNDLKNSQQENRNALESKLRGAIYSVSTLKAARELLPDFLDYLPEEDKPTKNLPAVANLIVDFKAAGFPKDKKGA